MKRVLLTIIMSVLVCVVVQAQDRTITGKVTDETGQGLPTVAVLIKGTTQGQATDPDGNYRITVPENATLIFRFLGYTQQEIAVGNQSTINIQMQPEVSELDEVVVTALGITRDKASLGYAVTSIGSNDLAARPEADVARLLRGKVPGVDIAQTSGIAGAGTNVIIRGYSSITGTNQPLFVVDGVPFNTDTNNDRGFTSGGATASSRFLDLDPNNISDISVLKGLSATVLYGEAGRNGVVLVTTRNTGGSARKRMDISLTQSYFQTEAASIPDDQDLYGNGFHNLASAAFSNWGAPFNQPGKNGTSVHPDNPNIAGIPHPYDRAAWNDALPEFQGAIHEYRDYDNLQGFFQKGDQVNTSLNISSRLSDVASINAAYGYIKENGYIQNNDYEKHNLSLGGRTKLSNGLSVSTSFNFITSQGTKPPAGTSTSSGPNGGTSLFSNVLYTPRSNDLHGWPFALPTTGESIYYRNNNGIQNPIWTLNNARDEELINRFFGNITLTYNLTDWLTANYRIGVDTYNQIQDFKLNSRGVDIPLGQFQTSNRLNTITDQVFTLSANRDINSDLNVDLLFGVNLRRETRKQDRIFSSNQFIFDLFTHQNFLVNTATTFIREENTIGVYGTASFGYRDFAYLNFQARNDWTSTLEKANRSVFYPSVSASFLPFDAFGVSSSTFNFLKVRAGYGTSAGYPNPYNTRNVLNTSVNAFVTQGGAIVNSNSVSTFFGNPDLKRELHEEIEVGIEGRFFKNRVTLDLSLYSKTSSDLIINLTLDPSTGFNNTTINAAELSNKGIEARLTGTVLQTNDWNLSLTGNFTKNVSTVNKIADGIDQIVFAGFVGLGNYAVPGETYGIIQGNPRLKDANGNPIVTGQGLYQNDPNLGVIGDPQPNFNTTFITELSYKWLSMRVQLDYQNGGDIFSSTAHTLLARGILEETGFDRFVPVVARGVKADGTPNNIQITSTNHYWRNGGVFNNELGVFDATHLRLREISLTAVFPSSWLAKTPFGSASLTLSGQNLWYKAFNFPESSNFDPEVLSLGVGNGRGFDFMSGPTSKKYGATLNVTF